MPMKGASEKTILLLSRSWGSSFNGLFLFLLLLLWGLGFLRSLALLGLLLFAFNQFLFFRFLLAFGQENSMNVRQDTTLSDRHIGQQLAELFIIADSKLKMTRNDSSLLIVSCSISCQLQNFSTQIFKNSSKINRSSTSNTACITALAQITRDTANRELKTCFRRARNSFFARSFTASTFALSHLEFSKTENEMRSLKRKSVESQLCPLPCFLLLSFAEGGIHVSIGAIRNNRAKRFTERFHKLKTESSKHISLAFTQLCAMKCFFCVFRLLPSCRFNSFPLL